MNDEALTVEFRCRTHDLWALTVAKWVVRVLALVRPLLGRHVVSWWAKAVVDRALRLAYMEVKAGPGGWREIPLHEHVDTFVHPATGDLHAMGS